MALDPRHVHLRDADPRGDLGLPKILFESQLQDELFAWCKPGE
jgi:hypothetical protein